MQLWLVFSLSLALLVVILGLSRVFLEGELRAQGNPDGSWFAVVGAATGPLAIASVASHATPLRLELFCFGRRVWVHRKSRTPAPERPTVPSEDSKKPSKLAELAASYFGTSPEDLMRHAEFALSLRRYVGNESLAVEVVYGFRDVALTGRIVAALSVLSAVLPRTTTLVHQPLWEGGERWEVRGKGKIGLWPGRALARVLWYMLALRWPKRTSPRSLEAS